MMQHPESSPLPAGVRDGVIEPARRVVGLFEPHRRPQVKAGLRVAMVGTFPPRQCGLATFTCDVVGQLAIHHQEIACAVFALDRAGSGLTYPDGVRAIRADAPDAYEQAARQINDEGFDAVWIQHEFGIFGGPDGEMVCDFVDRLAAPLVLTMHTVLRKPSPRQRAIVDHLVARASRIMAMSRQGIEVLRDHHGAPPERLEQIEHGAPDRPFGRTDRFKARLGLADRPVLMTFGLLSPGKGIERAIEALPAIVARHPRVVYRVVGATHPNLVAEQGEAYRESLVALARKLGVADHLEWDNRYLETAELLDQLEACDVYLTPYFNLQQATSGTLSYAVALGKAVVSTPYVHARELLGDEVGVLIEPNSAPAVADAVNALLDDPGRLAAMQRRAHARGRRTIWREFASAAARLVRAAAAPEALPIPFGSTPGLAAFRAMCDSTGMLQHADGIVPDRAHGYCLDDNARALMLTSLAAGLAPAERRQLSTIFAAFVRDAWNAEARRFRNFMRFDRSWCEDVGSEDSNGRALWALGHTVEHSPIGDMRDWALAWFERTCEPLAGLAAPRAMAFAMLGAAAVVRARGDHPAASAMLERGGAVLERLLERARRPDWAWFEAVLAYDNPRLSQALIEAGSLCRRTAWVDAGLDSLGWIAARQSAAAGHFRPVGCETFGRQFAALPFDQQPLEAQAAVEAAASAWRASGDPRWIDHAERAMRWYFGANDRGVALVDFATGLCRDGLTPRGANANCGAESILAFQLAHYGLMMLKSAAHPPARPGEERESRRQYYGQPAAHP